MSKKMLINALHAEEARVAIVEDGRLVDLDVEIAGNEQIRGNIYKGVVVRVEQGLQCLAGKRLRHASLLVLFPADNPPNLFFICNPLTRRGCQD